MKNIIIYCISLFVFVQVGNAAENRMKETLDRASSAYENKNYAGAATLYQSVIDSGYHSAELFYNVANAHYKMGDYPRAILNYERALLRNPGDEDIHFNLAKSRTYVIDKIDVIPEFFVKTLVKDNVVKLNCKMWALLALAVFTIAIVCLWVYFISRNPARRKVMFALAALFIVVFLFFGSFAYKAKNYIENSVSAIVMTPTVTVKSSPDNEGLDAFIIHEGTKVNVLRSLAGWYEIKIADGKQGWLKEADVEKI